METQFLEIKRLVEEALGDSFISCIRVDILEAQHRTEIKVSSRARHPGDFHGHRAHSHRKDGSHQEGDNHQDGSHQEGDSAGESFIPQLTDSMHPNSTPHQETVVHGNNEQVDATLVETIVQYLSLCSLAHPQIEFVVSAPNLGTLTFNSELHSMPVINSDRMSSIYGCQDIEVGSSNEVSIVPVNVECFAMLNTTLTNVTHQFVTVRCFWNSQPLSNNNSTELARVGLEHILGARGDDMQDQEDVRPATCLFQHCYTIHPTQTELHNIEFVFFIEDRILAQCTCSIPGDSFESKDFHSRTDLKEVVPLARVSCSKAMEQLTSRNMFLRSTSGKRDNKMCIERTVSSIYEIVHRSTNDALKQFCKEQLEVDSLEELPNALKDKLLHCQQQKPRGTKAQTKKSLTNSNTNSNTNSHNTNTKATTNGTRTSEREKIGERDSGGVDNTEGLCTTSGTELIWDDVLFDDVNSYECL